MTYTKAAFTLQPKIIVFSHIPVFRQVVATTGERNAKVSLIFCSVNAVFCEIPVYGHVHVTLLANACREPTKRACALLTK